MGKRSEKDSYFSYRWRQEQKEKKTGIPQKIMTWKEFKKTREEGPFSKSGAYIHEFSRPGTRKDLGWYYTKKEAEARLKKVNKLLENPKELYRSRRRFLRLNKKRLEEYLAKLQ